MGKLLDSVTQKELTDQEYFLTLREIYNSRNPHAVLGEVAGDEADEGV